MFGYVNIHKDLLRVCDYNNFKGYYCGLCKQLGKKFNQITRLGLSYDMTFLAILLSSLNSDVCMVKNETCIVHPFTKRPVRYNDNAIKYSADMSIILTYLKLVDDWKDEHSLKSFLRIFYFRHFNKTVRKYLEIFEKIKTNLDSLTKLEKQNCDDVDMVADCFGKVLMAVFDNDNSNKALAWLGYHIGRYIYIIDGYSDIEKDVKNKSYNPFVNKFGSKTNEQLENVKKSLLVTLNEIANAFNLLEIKQNKELLENIIFLGMRKNVDKLCLRKEEQNESV